MPANLTPDYLAADEKFRAAKSNEEKLAALEEMLSTIPKHKGTEKLQADIKRRIAKVREEGKKKGGGPSRRSDVPYIPKEGAGQVVLIGPPNSGKSSIVASLTKARPAVADYPFTTREPLAGMMEFENVQIQVLDTPPIASGYTPSWLAQLVRIADAAMMVVDAGDPDLLESVENVLSEMEGTKILLSSRPPQSPLQVGVAFLKTMILANKTDIPNAGGNVEALKDLYAGRFDVTPVSVRLDPMPLRRVAFDLLGVMRVYSKIPGKDADLSRPYVLKPGASVFEFASQVHNDFVSKLNFARIWGKGKYDGQRVNREFSLSDGDVVELHI